MALEAMSESRAYRCGKEAVAPAAGSGKAALREVLLRRFAVILLDVNMSEMDGFETAAAIQSRPLFADIPIIFITAFMADEVSKLDAYRYQAADFLFSPIIPQVLRAKVAVFVSLAAKNDELARKAQALATKGAELSAANVKLVAEIYERKMAEDSNRAKDDFLAMLGHELRNPLSAIKSASTVLAMPGLTRDAAARANLIIGRQAKKLRDIVDEILDLSRALSGKIQLHRQAVELSALVKSSLDAFAANGHTEGRFLTLSATTAWINGDVERVKQIVHHLIENAFKYTLQGAVLTSASKLARLKRS